ncbi:hypothetical protein KIPB_010110, partial [Kipferlia bialata]
KTISLVYSYQSVQSEYIQPTTKPAFSQECQDNYQLGTKKAFSSRVSNLADFRRCYGDYFVSGVKRGSVVNIVFTMTADTEEHMDEYKVTVGVELPEVAEAEVGVGQSWASGNEHININCQVFSEGFVAGAPSIAKLEDVGAALEWYRNPNNRVSAPISVQLQHYHTLTHGSTIPLVLDAHKDTVDQWRQYSSKMGQLRTLYNELSRRCKFPRVRGQESLDERFQTLADQHGMASQDSFSAAAVVSINCLMEELRLFEDRLVLLDRLKKEEDARLRDSPEDWKWCANGACEWDKGINDTARTVTNTDDTIYTYQEEYKEAAPWYGYNYHNFVFKSKQSFGEAMCVGFHLESMRKDDWGGGSWRVPKRALGETEATVEVASAQARECHWKINWYYVAKSSYNFLKN